MKRTYHLGAAVHPSKAVDVVVPRTLFLHGAQQHLGVGVPQVQLDGQHANSKSTSTPSRHAIEKSFRIERLAA